MICSYDVTGANFENSLYVFGQSEKSSMYNNTSYMFPRRDTTRFWLVLNLFRCSVPENVLEIQGTAAENPTLP